ncbi:MAG TPA: ABC transporter ATP-binding protein [Kofleriaceae bacterium]|nr:ABC transporter ATP-binding protein [Kofleriaceae bacterium]
MNALAKPALSAAHETAAVSADRIALRAGDFSFEVAEVAFRAGAWTAIVGPNGSGKTTLVEALLGFRAARMDNVRILGVPGARFMADTAQLRRLGAQLQRVEYADWLRVDEIVDVHRALYRRQSPIVAGALGLDELAKKPYDGLSKGQRQRLDLFVAMAHEPELLILDEPFTGLDKTYAGRVLELLTGALRGATVIMICHAGEELAAASDVLWVHQGGVKYQGSRAALKDRLVGRYRTLIHVESPAQEAELRGRLAADRSVLRVIAGREPLQIEAYGGEGLDAVVRALMDSAHLRHFELAPATDSDLLRICTQAGAITGAIDA